MISIVQKQTIKNTLSHIGFIAVFSFSLASCGNTGKNNSDMIRDESISKEEIIKAESTGAPAISFKDGEGKTVSLNSLVGKVVFINFWATWCPPCIHEMPSINELKKSFEGNEDIVFLMVDVDNNIKQSLAFMSDNSYDLPVYTPASNIPSDYLNGSIPTTIVLNKKGEMVDRMEGGRDYSDPEIAQALKELLKE